MAGNEAQSSFVARGGQLSYSGLPLGMGVFRSRRDRMKLAFVVLVLPLAACANNRLARDVAQQQQPQQQISQAEQRNNIASLSEVIKANPTDANALNLRGSAYGQAGDYDQALADFNAALQINPQFSQALANRALVYVRMKRLQDALADYDRAINIDPKYASAYIGRGNIHRLAKNHPMAIADFSSALEIEANPVAYFNRGLSRQAVNEHAQAIDDFDNALGFRADAAEVYQAKGISEMVLRKYENAAENFIKAAQGSKNNYEAWALRGQAIEAMGQPQEAAKAYQRALQINPSFQPARQGLERTGRAA